MTDIAAGQGINLNPVVYNNRMLRSRYLAKPGILTLGPDEPVQSRWGINIDNFVILDFDSERYLMGIELLILRQRWSVGKMQEFHVSQPLRSLQATVATLEYGYRNLPIEVLTNIDRSHVLIRIGQLTDDSRPFALSPSCVALTCEGRLSGFVVAMPG